MVLARPDCRKAPPSPARDGRTGPPIAAQPDHHAQSAAFRRWLARALSRRWADQLSKRARTAARRSRGQHDRGARLRDRQAGPGPARGEQIQLAGPVSASGGAPATARVAADRSGGASIASPPRRFRSARAAGSIRRAGRALPFHRGIPRWNGSARPARRILPAARADRNRRGGEAIEAPPERSAATRAVAGAPPDADTGPAS